MFLFPQPVLADLGAIIQAIIFLVILGSGVAKMFRESQEVQKRADRQRPRPERGEGGAPQVAEAKAAQPQRPPQETIRSEVEEFLRRVGQADEDHHAGDRQRQTARRRRQPQIEVLEDGSEFEKSGRADSGFGVDERPRHSHRKRRRSKEEQPQVKRQPQSPPAKGIERGESVADHVAEHLRRGEFDVRASHLGEELSQTDERLEARLHQKFDHGLGNLSALRQAREAADLKLHGEQNADSRADDLLELLATPQGVQQAIILSEMLNRPTDRW